MINLGERAWSLLKLRRLQQRTTESVHRRGCARRSGSAARLAQKLFFLLGIVAFGTMALAAEREFTLDNVETLLRDEGVRLRFRNRKDRDK